MNLAITSNLQFTKIKQFKESAGFYQIIIRSKIQLVKL